MPEKPPLNRLSMEIDPEAIQAIVSQNVNAQIAIALEKQGIDFHGAVVNAIMNAHVKNDGTIIQAGHYDYNRSPTWFDWEVQNMLRQCAKDALREFMDAQTPKIQAAMMAAFKKRTPQIVKALTDGTMKAFSDKWSFKFNVDIQRME